MCSDCPVVHIAGLKVLNLEYFPVKLFIQKIYSYSLCVNIDGTADIRPDAMLGAGGNRITSLTEQRGSISI
jgi:hypothetical protein